MKNFKSIYRALGVFLFSSMLLFSCKYDSDIAHPEKYETVYMTQALNNPATHNLTMSDTDQTIIYGANFSGTGYPGNDIKVEFEVDNSLIDSFNTKNGTSYLAMPDGSYTLEKSETIIPKGKTSTEPLELKIKTFGVLSPAKVYLLPLRISKAGKDSISSNMGITYFLISAKFNIVNVYMSEGGNEEVQKALKVSNDPQVFSFTAEYDGTDPEADVQVKFKTDPALATSFNQANNTSYIPLPGADYEMEQNAAKITKGAFASNAVNIKVHTDALIPFEKYILPISIDTATANLSVDKQISMDKDKRVAYYIVQAVTDPVNKDSVYGDYNRKNWAVIDFDAEAANDPTHPTANEPASNVLDGDISTQWELPWWGSNGKPRPAHPHFVSIALNEKINMHGIYIVPTQASGAYGYPHDFYVETSMDGTEWTKVAEFKNQTFDGHNRKNCYFDFTIPAKYFKLVIVNSNGGSPPNSYPGTRISELGAF